MNETNNRYGAKETGFGEGKRFGLVWIGLAWLGFGSERRGVV